MSHRIQHISKINRITDVKTTLRAACFAAGQSCTVFCRGAVAEMLQHRSIGRGWSHDLLTGIEATVWLTRVGGHVCWAGIGATSCGRGLRP